MLRMERSREFRARGELDGRGLIRQIEQTIGGKVKFFHPTDKGTEWARKRNIRIKKFKSGIVHEYLLCQMGRRIGRIGTKWRLQSNSSIGRDQGLQPDLLVMEPGGRRFIIEVCCSNFDYDAKNILAEADIPGVDGVIAITPDKRTRRSLDKALQKSAGNSGKNLQKSILLFDAGECLAEEFDWASVLLNS